MLCTQYCQASGERLWIKLVFKLTVFDLEAI